MGSLKIYNSLTRKVEEFKPIKKGRVGVYSCGPTVYWNQHIGHMYAYVQWDCLVRSLEHFGFKVKWVMNITDVGHMTSDADTGEDKMEKGAKREGLTVWQIAKRYIAQFEESLDLLGIREIDEMSRVTDNIEEQIELIKRIEKRGFTYMTKTGLVFDTGKFADYAKFAKLNLEKQRAGARVEVDEEKKKAWDFLLWVTNQPKHAMQWNSPWGRGFPGWHIECTAISAKYLGERFDIHTGGKEHVPVHHTNEIAQSFGAFGKQTANYWLHNEWLVFEGEKMSKSLGNNVLVTDLVEKGFDPLALRYLILTSHYRSGLNFTWDSLKGAQMALERLRSRVRAMKEDGAGLSEIEEKWREKFEDRLRDDLDMPGALAVVWELVKSDQADSAKRASILKFDEVLGLRLGEEGSQKRAKARVTEKFRKPIEKRRELRSKGKYEEADRIREEIEKQGFEVKDETGGTVVVEKQG